jgi:hypothetical protein
VQGTRLKDFDRTTPLDQVGASQGEADEGSEGEGQGDPYEQSD